MRTPRLDNGRGPGLRGFTLLEVMVGVGITGLLVIAMYRLVGTQLQAIQISRESQLQSSYVDGVTRYVQGVLSSIPPKQAGGLIGLPHVFGLSPGDEMQWTVRPGMALLTSAATQEDFVVTFTLQPRSSNSSVRDLGIRRRRVGDPDSSYDWVPLMPDIGALEFRYFHPALNTWLDRWEDANSRPSLVRMKLWRRVGEEPYEVVFTVPSSRVN